MPFPDDETVTEQGEVVRLEGDLATVVIQRAEACGHCAASGACLALSGGSLRELTAVNGIGAAVGDRVEVSVPQGVALRAVGWAYVLPTVIVLAVALLAHRFLAPRLSDDAAGLLSALSALAVLGLYVLGAWTWRRRKGPSRRALPRVTRWI